MIISAYCGLINMMKYMSNDSEADVVFLTAPDIVIM